MRKYLPFLALPALLLLGCTTLPRIVPGRSIVDRAPLDVVGARGRLSDAHSKALIKALSETGPATGIYERHLAVEEAIVGSPLSSGNAVLLLQDGPATYRAMLASIAAARDHIHMETYILDGDAIGVQFVDALIAKQRQGVQVSLIRDSVGTVGTPAALFDRLTASGAQVLEFNPLNPLAAHRDWAINERDHRKLLIVDGSTAFLGGINISSVYSGGSARNSARKKANAHSDVAWRDTDLRLQGPVVAEFQRLFVESWDSLHGEPLVQRDWYPTRAPAGTLVVRAIGSSPDESFSQIYATLLSAIANAQTSIQITNAYFVPDPQLLTALAAAAGHGVAVTLILPSRTDSWLVFHAGRGYYDGLLSAGVRIYEREGVVLHSKVALIDGVWATVGSTNLDWRSFLHNHELNAVVLGSDFGDQVNAMFAKDLARSRQITLQQWRRRGIAPRMAEWFARQWQYWL